MKIAEITVSENETHHLYHKKELYTERFKSVLKFHDPGLAPVLDSSGAYHIMTTGEPAYPHRFLRTFGFYEDRAAVETNEGWRHILPSGEPLYLNFYQWCGNFQNQRCTVKEGKHYFHIDLDGLRVYPENYAYAGDFRDGIAVVQSDEGHYFHIKFNGTRLHQHAFLDLDVFHKGFARAKDQQGWFHIDIKGAALYSERYQMVENFYNGVARVEKDTGELVRIDERGEWIEQLREPLVTPFQQLSGDLVGYWKTQTIKAAVDLNVFDYLPLSSQDLAKKIGVTQENTLRLLRALQEIKLVSYKDNLYAATERAVYLTKQHSLSLHAAATVWADAHYVGWMSLTKALKGDQECYETIYEKPWFEWLDDDKDRLASYHQAMTSYARHDYKELSKALKLEHSTTIIDAAGGEGTLLKYILEQNPTLTGTLLERESLIEIITIPKEMSHRMNAEAFDLFKPWPVVADTILLSRVLHDWDDKQCQQILAHVTKALNPGGELIIIEFLLNDSESGGMLDLNMLVITGGKERRLEGYIQLAGEEGLSYQSTIDQGSYQAMRFKKSHV